MIDLDVSVALAQLFAEYRHPPERLYVDDLTRLRRDGDVLPSIADDLLDDAAAVIAVVDAQIAG